jgi:hypothetical protein
VANFLASDNTHFLLHRSVPYSEESSTASKNPVGSDNEEDDGEKKQPAEDVQEGKDAQEGDSSKRLAIAHFKPKKIQRKYKKAPNAPKRFRSGKWCGSLRKP